MTEGVTGADFVTAAAALTAAALSGATLYVTGRRGEPRWRRNALIDASEVFANTSFARSGREFRTLRAREHDETLTRIPPTPDELDRRDVLRGDEMAPRARGLRVSSRCSVPERSFVEGRASRAGLPRRCCWARG